MARLTSPGRAAGLWEGPFCKEPRWEASTAPERSWRNHSEILLLELEGRSRGGMIPQGQRCPAWSLCLHSASPLTPGPGPSPPKGIHGGWTTLGASDLRGCPCPQTQDGRGPWL